jgi:hypothetical protein
MISLADKVVALHHALDAHALPHAFGGALALAWCTHQPRGTVDIDLNIFVPTSSARLVLEALQPAIETIEEDALRLEREGQCRLLWEATPVDIFLNTTEFHEATMARSSLEPFAGEMVPFLSCPDLVVFKAFFDRRRDWADIEDVLRAGSIDVDAVVAVLADHLGADDERIAKLRLIDLEVH